MSGIFCDFVVHDGTIFAVDTSDLRLYKRQLPDSSSNRCQGFDPTLAEEDRAWMVASSGSVVAVAVHAGIIYGVGNDKRIYTQQIASMTQESEWTPFGRGGKSYSIAVGCIPSDAIHNEVIYVVGTSNVVYSQPLALPRRWEKLAAADKMMALAVQKGQLFGVATNNKIYVLDSSCHEWRWIGHGWATALAADESSDMLYVLGTDHAIYRKAVVDVESMQASCWECALQTNSNDPTPLWEKICGDYSIADETRLQSSLAVETCWRLLCISDTHGQHDLFDMEDIRKLRGHILIHAGDLTNRGCKQGLDNIGVFFSKLLAEKVVQHVIAIAGNHDRIMQNEPEAASASLNSVCNYLEDEGAIISGIEFYGSPWQPEYERHAEYCRAFTLRRGEELKAKWERIPSSTDVVVVHGPPLGCRDLTTCHRRAGCKDLLDAILRLHPRVVVFGHIHEGYGCSRLNGDTGILLVNAASLQRGRGLRPPIVVELPKDRSLPARWVHTESTIDQKPSGFGLL